MDKLLTIINKVKKNYFMASVTLSDACYYIPIATGHQQYLCFHLNENSTSSFCFQMVFLDKFLEPI